MERVSVKLERSMAVCERQFVLGSVHCHIHNCPVVSVAASSQFVNGPSCAFMQNISGVKDLIVF